MDRNAKHTVIRIGCFLLLLVTILWGTNRIFKFKYGDGIYDLTKFYQLEDDTVDVLILGSSHAFEDINTGLLWDEHGMASFILSGSMQPMWNTYYYLKEALKTQKPSLIILEAYMAGFPEEYADDSRIIKNNFGLKLSADKIRSLHASVPPGRFPEFFLEYIQYHNRYRELGMADILPDQGYELYKDWKGYGCNMDTIPQENSDISGVTETVDLKEKSEHYLRKTIELAKERDIPVLILVSPYASVSDVEQMVFNRTEEIAAEYGVEFINYNLNYRELGIDYAEDAGDAFHLNYKGSRKLTEALGKHLKSRYDIPDRRGDARYDSWERHAAYLRRIIGEQEEKEKYSWKTTPVRTARPRAAARETEEIPCSA